MVWTRGLDPGIQEGTPLVHDGVMYFPNPSDVMQAIDAATGDLLWEYRRTVPEDLGKYFPVPPINRNLAIYGNLIIDTERRRLRVRARRAHRQARLGDADPRLHSTARSRRSGPDHRERQGHLRPRLRARGRPATPA